MAAEEGAAIPVQGYFISIVGMVALPFLMVGAFIAFMVISARRARSDGAASDPSEGP